MALTDTAVEDMQQRNRAEVQSKISEQLTQLSPTQPKCSIYRVYSHLRNLNNEAYEPQIISIGPYHHNKHNLQMMENHKLRYLQRLLHHRNLNLERFISVVGELEQEARECYAEPINLSSLDFIKMMVLDGCFIIELVRKCTMEHLRDKNDPIFQMDWIMSSLKRDLMLFENQIPFFVLRRLFELIEVPNDRRLIYLISSFFEDIYPGKGYKMNVNGSLDEIKHILDLIHINCLPSLLFVSNIPGGFNDEEGKKIKWRFIQSATVLEEANIKFQRSESNTLFEIKFERGILSLPPLTVEDRTESFFRNLIAYEQYFQDTQTNFVTGYVKFLDCLIDSSKDVQILSRNGIIDNWLGADEVVANMFNKLTDSVVGPDNRYRYLGIFASVNRHCNKRRNRWMATLRHNYFNSPWAIISVIVAFVLLVLTIVQTVCSILQVV